MRWSNGRGLTNPIHHATQIRIIYHMIHRPAHSVKLGRVCIAMLYEYSTEIRSGAVLIFTCKISTLPKRECEKCTSSVASMSAPFFINNCAILTWPFLAATSNGVHPSCACTKLVKYTTSNQVLQNNTNIALLHTIQFPISRTSHALLVEGYVSCFIACAFQCGKLIQQHKRCAMCWLHQSHISAEQQFPHIALAYALIQSQCPYCVHPCKKAILRVKFGLWMHHFVHSSITAGFHAIKTDSFKL